MSIYDLDYSILISEFLPPDKREDVQKAWLLAMHDTVIENHDDIFNVFRNDIISQTKHNGQKIIMEDVLNTTFNVVGPPFIYIDNTGDDKGPQTFFNDFEGYPAEIFFNESEAQPAFFFFNESETIQNKDFKVYVPSAIYTAEGEARIRSEVDRLRPYATQYTVISY